MTRRYLPLVLVASFFSLGAAHRTQNFVVHAPTPQIAERVGQWAEFYRREKAIQWLGQEMQPWRQPCPLQVTVTMGPPSGATSFSFGPRGVQSQRMEIQGRLDRLIKSVLPHEITHTVFAYHFRRPVPRWADEGGSVLSEDELEKQRHHQLTRQILKQGRQIPLRRLFSLTQYPRDVMCLYAQGFSMASFLVGRSDRRTYLNFVGHGMQYGWDRAVQTYYRYRSVEELESAWLKHVFNPQQPSQPQQPEIVAQNDQTMGRMRGTVVRMTVPPAQPLASAPIIRGQMGSEQPGQRFGDNPSSPQPRYLPDPRGQAQGGWRPTNEPRAAAQPRRHAPVPIRLGQPQFDPTAAPAMPQGNAPIGYPR